MCKRSLSSSCLCMIRVGGAGKRAAQCSGPVGHKGGEGERERGKEGGREKDRCCPEQAEEVQQGEAQEERVECGSQHVDGGQCCSAMNTMLSPKIRQSRRGKHDMICL